MLYSSSYDSASASSWISDGIRPVQSIEETTLFTSGRTLVRVQIGSYIIVNRSAAPSSLEILHVLLLQALFRIRHAA